MERIGKAGFTVLVSGGRAKLQLGGSQDGGWVYTEYDPGVQNGNSGE